MKQVVFFGSIGVGKTTAGNILESKFQNVQFLKEDLDENPFLPAFYNDMKKWGFHSSVAMLALMSSYYKKINQSKDIVILDNGVEELIAYTMLECDLEILSEEEFKVYKKLYDNIVNFLPKTDLYVYFKCEEKEALRRIKKRNREFEMALDLNFLKRLNHKYEDFAKTLPNKKLLIIDTTNNYSLDELINEISKRINVSFVE